MIQPGSLGLSSSDPMVYLEAYSLSDMAMKSRFVSAWREGCTRYPIYRDLRFAARVSLDDLFDDLALNLGWMAQRPKSGEMLLDAGHTFIIVQGARKSNYCSAQFRIWAERPEFAALACDAILQRVNSSRIREPMFTIDWHFASKGGLRSISIEEMADDLLCDAAYPTLPSGVAQFVQRYLDAKETILVLQGPPGTGKTRLIRAILGALSDRKGGAARALFTGDAKALESDELFVQFITGLEDAFVVEDADHLLKPRSEGNQDLHRFLAIADGVVRSQGKKIIFSTNLPNVGDLDDALVRPGRCFARLHLRELSLSEAEGCVRDISSAADDAEIAIGHLKKLCRTSFSLAEVYAALEKSRERREPRPRVAGISAMA